jgi:histidyl-tRNA synthetase
MFRKEPLPTTGVSLGIERIIDVMDELGLYPPEATRLAAQLRGEGINTELILQDKKLGQQFGTADKKGIPVVAVQGPDEAAQGVVKLKRLRDAMEITVPASEIAVKVRELLA